MVIRPAFAFVPVVAVLTTACGGLLCDYETDPTCEDPNAAQVSGTLTIAGQEAGQQSVGAGRGAVDPSIQSIIGAVRAAAPATHSRSIGTKRRIPLGDKGTLVPTKTPTERWRSGEIVVLADSNIRDRKAEMSVAYGALLTARMGFGIDAHVGVCGRPERCLVHVIGGDGKELNEELTALAAASLALEPGVRFAEKNLILQATIYPDDEFYSYQWHYPAISLEQAWEITTGDESIVGAVIDTGILLDHPDLEGRIVGGADLIDDASVGGDGDGRDDNGNDDATQSVFHGTHVAGTMAANSDNGLMVSGMNWQGRLLAVRVLGVGGSGSMADIIDGVEWAIGGDVDGVSQNPTPADVLNLSLGGPGSSEIVDEQMQRAADSGAIVIVAAGNDNTDASEFTPANAPSVITVGALGNGDGGAPSRASYSNFGNTVEISAPGGEQATGEENGVLSTQADYVGYLQGTSMASPHVAGLAMLMKSVRRDINQTEALQALQDTADTDIDCNDGCGSGQINAYAAVLAAGGEAAGGLTGGNVRARRGETTANVVFRNFGDTSISVTFEVGGANRDAVTLDIDSATIPAKGKATVVATIARNEEGTDTGSATITAVGDASVEARLDWTSDAGPVVQEAVVAAVLLNADGSFVISRTVTTTAVQGNAYKLFNLVPGSYVIVGLIDSDGNGDYGDDVDGSGYYQQSTTADGEVCSTSGCGVLDLEAGGRVDAANFLVTAGFVPGDDTGGRGTGDVGAACTTSGDCGDGLYCEAAFENFGGYCTTDCSNGPSDCPDGSTCFNIGDAEPYQICFQNCADTTDCRDGFVCDQDNTCFPG